MVQVAIDQVVHVVAVGDRFVAAAVAVPMTGFVPGAGMVGRTSPGVRVAHLDAMFVDVIFVGKVQVPVVKIVDVVTVLHRSVAAAGAVDVVRVMVGRVMGHGVVAGLGSGGNCRSQARERGRRRFE